MRKENMKNQIPRARRCARAGGISAACYGTPITKTLDAYRFLRIEQATGRALVKRPFDAAALIKKCHTNLQASKILTLDELFGLQQKVICRNK
jgi:hypothetical protein